PKPGPGGQPPTGAQPGVSGQPGAVKPLTVNGSPAPTLSASPVPTSSASPAAPTPTASPTRTDTGAVHGTAFVDADANGQLDDPEAGLSRVDITLTFADGRTLIASTDDSGAFAFQHLPPGT